MNEYQRISMDDVPRAQHLHIHRALHDLCVAISDIPAADVKVAHTGRGIDAMEQWLAMLRKVLERNYDRLDEVLASMEKPKRGEKR